MFTFQIAKQMSLVASTSLKQYKENSSEKHNFNSAHFTEYRVTVASIVLESSCLINRN